MHLLQFPTSDIDIKERSPLVLAFIGDSVLELLVRERLACTTRMNISGLHKESVKLVSAKGQYFALSALEDVLTEKEKEMVRRGKNANKSSVPKNASSVEYSASNGLETLLGWLYLSKENKRIEQLFEIIWQNYLQINHEHP